MAVKRISDLTALTTPDLTKDYFLVSRPIEGKSYKLLFNNLFETVKGKLDIDTSVQAIVKSYVLDKITVAQTAATSSVQDGAPDVGNLLKYNSTTNTWTANRLVTDIVTTPGKGGINFSAALGNLKVRWGTLNASYFTNPDPEQVSNSNVKTFTIPSATLFPTTGTLPDYIDPAKTAFLSATVTDITGTDVDVNVSSLTYTTVKALKFTFPEKAPTASVKFLIIGFS